jgi:hypothetical protein
MLDCGSLESVKLGPGVSTIGFGAFSGCPVLTRITVSPLNSFYRSLDGVLYNKNANTLIRCPGGKPGSYTVPSGVTHVGGEAFESCASLNQVTIPDTVTSIGDGAFLGCAGLTAITVDALNPVYGSTDGVLFHKPSGILIRCPQASTGSYTVPHNVTAIGNDAFSSCASLTNVIIPVGVTRIGDRAFRYCSSLDSVMLPASVTSLGDYVFAQCTSLAHAILGNSATNIPSLGFSGCSSLNNVVLGNRVTEIEDFAFGSCASLSRIVLPASVTDIRPYAFYDCPSLSAAYSRGNAPSISDSAFSFTDNVTVYYLPETTGWGPTFGSRPTALWNPRVQTADPTFGLQPGGFGLPINGTVDIPIVLEAAPSLGGSEWTPLLSGTLTNGAIHYIDLNHTDAPARFYRIRSP